MQLFVPELGTLITLLKDWKFDLHYESTNEDLLKHIKAEGKRDKYGWYEYGQKPTEFTLPAGTILKVDRIYIRKGKEKFSSLSFYIQSTPLSDNMEKDKPLFGNKKFRFWAKLDDVNNIEFGEAAEPEKKKVYVAFYNGEVTERSYSPPNGSYTYVDPVINTYSAKALGISFESNKSVEEIVKKVAKARIKSRNNKIHYTVSNPEIVSLYETDLENIIYYEIKSTKKTWKLVWKKEV